MSNRYAANTAPSWVPLYPGSTPNGTVSSTTPDGSQNTFSFKSKDSPSQVMTFYTDALKSAGFKINQTISSDKASMLQASDDDKKRTVVVTVGASGDGTETAVTSIEKK